MASSSFENMMLAKTQQQVLASSSNDYVQDLAFDFYGRRIAMCCGDRTVRVWDLGKDGEWVSSESSEWRAHRGTVTRVSWAHPEFGPLLVTGGTDNMAIVWEGSSSKRWLEKATLMDARRSITAVSFAPRHLGLKLATGSADGTVRIYETIDAANLHHWRLNDTIDAELSPPTTTTTTTSNDTTRGSLNSDRSNKERNSANQSSSAGVSGNSSTNSSSGSELGVTCLSWCTGRFEPPTMVIGGSSGNVVVYRYSDASRTWNSLVKLPQHAGGVLDVSWSPNVGRSYHLIASAGRDGTTLCIHRLRRVVGSGGLELESTQELDTRGSQVWRVEWNVTGTVLASSGDGGRVRLWKCDFSNKWKCVSEVYGDVTSSAPTTNEKTKEPSN
mmetsp:Transcript_23094/g.41686  ORF Transcript_23094/g.41686 Transcript_23094/m.41686 type:complete len:386 (-) Transcript_23094:962-2119(-)